MSIAFVTDTRLQVRTQFKVGVSGVSRSGSRCEVQLIHKNWSDLKQQNIRNNATADNRAFVGIMSFIQN